ncbi:MAG: hypothetical protein IT210_04380 [Armatimonadetes bacterium]|nr:hypothetical protein [Armatimonadota bacterium]
MLSLFAPGVLVAASLISVAAVTESGPQPPVVRGIYGSPQEFWQKGMSLRDHHVNAIFVHYSAIDEETIRRAHEEGCRVYAEFATLNGDGYVEKHPEAWPVDETGQESPRQLWFMGVCPTDEVFLRYRLEALEKLVSRYDLDGVWLDYLHWHNQFEEPKPILVRTCFNESCLKRFEKETGLRPEGATIAEKAKWILARHEKQWNDWRCSVTADWAAKCREVLKRHRPRALLGNYQCPWTDEEFDRALWRYMGIDLNRLPRQFDIVSPMVYHGRMGRPAGWVGEYVEWLGKRLKVRPASRKLRIWPIVQAWSDPEGHAVSAEEFRRVLQGGMAPPASGVMMFTTGAVASEPEKAATMKELYRSPTK